MRNAKLNKAKIFKYFPGFFAAFAKHPDAGFQHGFHKRAVWCRTADNLFDTILMQPCWEQRGLGCVPDAHADLIVFALVVFIMLKNKENPFKPAVGVTQGSVIGDGDLTGGHGVPRFILCNNNLLQFS